MHWLGFLTFNLDKGPLFERNGFSVFEFVVLLGEWEPFILQLEIVACLLLEIKLKSEIDFIGGIVYTNLNILNKISQMGHGR